MTHGLNVNDIGTIRIVISFFFQKSQLLMDKINFNFYPDIAKSKTDLK